ncbi:type I-E CRISPR-associated protein Cas5/CasD [Nocardiopsis sp. NPDC050513]|uniref:type I-E CRISPR-associated protein Cas5/CasD n=1 Tax=Nocardiopsis sp. NPDC050513 TaxID=3364338 RepID=UPI0037B93E02
MSEAQDVLVLRLAGPLQAWGANSEYNRRETQDRPTKSGVIGLLAAADGRARGDDIRDLTGLKLGVRVDQPGRVLRDYHTTSDYRGGPLLSSQVNAKGIQKATSPAKPTYVTQRFYLEDAVFVVALRGPAELIQALSHAIGNPAFPLSLGRRSCPPTQPLRLSVPSGMDTAKGLESVLRAVPWQAGDHARVAYRNSSRNPETIDLAATVEDDGGSVTVEDVPGSFTIGVRTWDTRCVRHLWIPAPTGLTASPNPSHGAASPDPGDVHDPFALLGW